MLILQFFSIFCTKIDNSKNQSQYPYRFVGTLIEFIVKGGFTSRYESAFLHHSSRSWVADEVSADERLDVSRIADLRYHQSKGLGAYALAPIRFAHPIAHRGFSFPSRQATVARRSVAHGSYCLTGLIPYDSPCGGIIEHGTDYLQTLLFRKMRRPTCPRPNLRVACILIQSLGISVKPRAKGYSLCLHHSSILLQKYCVPCKYPNYWVRKQGYVTNGMKQHDE